MEGRHSRLVTVDALRAVAALAVMMHHAPRFEGPLHGLAAIQDRGYMGVGLFLVLSGFSIHFRWASRQQLGGFAHGEFWRRRVRRLYPAYLGALLLSLIVYVAIWGAPVSARSWPVVGVPPALAALFAQFLLPLSSVVPYTYVGVAWTLGLELQLYAIYTMLVTRLRRIGVWRVLLASAAITLLFRAVMLKLSPHDAIDQSAPYALRMVWTWAPSRLFEWMLGMAAAEAYFGRLKVPRITEAWPVAAALIATGLAAEHHELLADPVMGLAFVCVLRASIRLETRPAIRRALLPLAAVGFFSYSLYVVHVALLAIGRRELAHTSLGTNLRLLLLLPSVVAAAYLFHRVFERPFLVHGQRRIAAIGAPATEVSAP